MSDLSAWIAGWLFVAIGGMVTFEVVARYGFSAPTIWAEELSRFLQVWAVYLASAYALRYGHLIRITLLTDRLGERGRRIAEGISLSVIALLAVIALGWGTAIALESLGIGRVSTTMLRTPLWMAELAIPLGALILLLQCLAQMIRLLRGEPVGVARRNTQPRP